MEIDLRTVAIKPLRNTFDHIARRFGDKPATRYQEGTYDVQQTDNFHYRPMWEPDLELFDKRRTKIQMSDWYALKDPRQFYYGSWTIARSRQQEAAESNFEMVEERDLAASVPKEVLNLALDMLVPMRHAEWGGNMGNAYIAAYGYGTAITQPCTFHSMDHLAVAQYLTRIGLILGDAESLESAKKAWMDSPVWQPLRQHVENLLVEKDWFEIFVAQNFVLEGLLYPLYYDKLDKFFSDNGGTVVSMMTRFMTEWSAESAKWVDAQIKVAAAESDQNLNQINDWVKRYKDATLAAIKPLAKRAFGSDSDNVIASVQEQFDSRCKKSGLNV